MDQLGKLLASAIGALLGAGVVATALSLVASACALIYFAASMVPRRDWVPIVYNLRSLRARKWTTLFTAVGLALVVFVFTTVLMLAEGVHKTLASTGSPDNAKVIRKGSTNEIQSGLLPENFRYLGSLPEVAVGKDGQPLVAPEVAVLIFALKESAKDETDGANVTVRGVGERALEIHDGVHIEGRSFQPGTSEILVGKGLVGRFRGMRIGGQVHFARRDWTVVGILDAHGSAFDSEVWCDVDQALDAFQRRPSVSSVTLRLRGGAMKALTDRCASDPQLATMDCRREIDYWAGQSEMFATFVRILGLMVSVIFAFGAVLGAMITMYAQVAARTREIGVLRALGFRRRSVLASFVVESLFLALLAGGVGVAAASVLQAFSFSTMNFQSFSEVSFRFVLSPRVIALGLGFAALMGYAGGLLPAVRAARMPITQATRGG
jgi:ABC-type lipoprotein release transport system permease subunit